MLRGSERTARHEEHCVAAGQGAENGWETGEEGEGGGGAIPAWELQAERKEEKRSEVSSVKRGTGFDS